MINLNFPRYRLLERETPLQRLTRIEEKLGRVGLYIKRDDHMEIAVGGNKLRSLEFWIGAAQNESADVLLVAGKPVSNLCRMTAAVAAKVGMRCVVVHNAEENDLTRRDSLLTRLYGADVRCIGDVSEPQRAEAVKAMAAEFRASGRRPYIVGDEVVGALGYVAGIEELHRQAGNIPLRHVVLSGSMGTTEAGVIVGNILLGRPFKVHLISVEYDAAELERRLRDIASRLASFLGKDNFRLSQEDFSCDVSHLGPGYAIPTEESEQAILALARTEGVLLEHTYTAKTFAGFMCLAKGAEILRHESMCFIHTGGVPALFSQFELFKKL